MRAPKRLIAVAMSMLPCISLAALAAPVGSEAAVPRVHHARHDCALRAARVAIVGRLAPSCRVTDARAGASPDGRRRPAAGHARSSLPSAVPQAAPTTPGPAQTADQESPAASIAEALTASCQNTELVPTADDIELVRTAVLCLINRERAQHGELPLQDNPQLQEAAEEHSSELVVRDYFAHVSPTGLTPVQRISATGYIPGPHVGYVIGENLAWGTLALSTPQSIVAAWIASPDHLANILEGSYRDTGVGIAPAVPASLGGGEPGATYAQEFGVIIP